LEGRKEGENRLVKFRNALEGIGEEEAKFEWRGGEEEGRKNERVLVGVT